MHLDFNRDYQRLRTLNGKYQTEGVHLIYNASSTRHDHVGKHVHELGRTESVFKDSFLSDVQYLDPTRHNKGDNMSLLSLSLATNKPGRMP